MGGGWEYIVCVMEGHFVFKLLYNGQIIISYVEFLLCVLWSD